MIELPCSVALLENSLSFPLRSSLFATERNETEAAQRPLQNETKQKRSRDPYRERNETKQKRSSAIFNPIFFYEACLTWVGRLLWPDLCWSCVHGQNKIPPESKFHKQCLHRSGSDLVSIYTYIYIYIYI